MTRMTLLTRTFLVFLVITGLTISSPSANAAAPLAVDDSKTTPKNTPVDIDVLSNDTADIGASLATNTVKIVRPFRRGIFALRNGQTHYSPLPDFVGTDTFKYTVQDDLGNISNQATVTVKISGAPTDITLSADTLAENQASGTAIGSFTSTDANTGDTHTYTLVTGTGDTDNASFQIVGDALQSAAPLDYETKSAYRIRVRSTDSDTLYYEKEFTITVTDINDAPSFTKGADQTVSEDDGPQTVTGWATNIDDSDSAAVQTLTFNVTNNTNSALFSASPAIDPSTGTLTYTPAANANGTATITLTLSDNGGTADGGADTSAAQTFTITVNDINDAPSFTKGGDQTVNEDAGAQTVNGWATAINAGPANESSQTVSFDVSNDNNALFSVQPAISATGELTYTPAANTNGNATVTVQLSDSGSGTAPNSNQSTAQTFTITVDSVNDAPSFTKGGDQTVNEDAGAQTASGWATAISAGPADESSQTVSFDVSNDNNALFSVQPAISATGELTYTPAANANGSTTVTVQLNDNGSGTAPNVNQSAAQTFTITVNSVNDTPSFTKGADQTADEDAGAQTASGWATAISDGDPDATQTLTFNVTNNTNPTLFSAGPAVSNTGVLTYTPSANANGTATITLTLSDSGGTANSGVDTSAAQTFTITVNSINDKPSFTASNPTAVNEDAGAQSVTSWATFNAGAANESAQTAAYTVSSVSNPSLFSEAPSVASNGTLTYTSAANAFGTSTFTVTVQDSGGTANGGVDTSSPQTFTITVNAVDDPPVAVADSATLTEDSGANAIDVLANDTDIDAGPKTVNAVGTASHGTVTITGGGTGVSYTPAANYCNQHTTQDTFTYTLNGGSSTTVAVTVTCVNDAPVAANKTGVQIQSNMKRTSIDASLTTGITDPDSGVDGCVAQTFSVASVTTGTNGTVSNVSTGLFDFEPNAGINGTGAATASYTVQDNGATNTNCPGPALTSAAKSISFDVLGPVIWFVDDNAAAGGDGRLGHELQTIGAATTAVGASTNHKIFVYSGTYAQGASLNTDGWLIGQGVTAGGFDTAFGITPPSGTIARPSVNGTRPTLQNTVTMGANSQVKGLNISSSASNGIAASSKTGLTVSEVSVTTTSGTAASFTSGSANGVGGTLSFTAISSNGASSGIVLQNTTGSFTVTGIGSTAGSGGVIQSSSGPGISLTSASGVNLSRMNIQSGVDDGIRGSSVTGLSLTGMQITNNGNAAGEAGIDLTNLFGSSTWSSVTVTGSAEDNVVIRNSSGTLTALNVTSSTFSSNSGIGNDGFLIDASGTANITASVTGSTFSANRGDHFQAAAANSAVLDVTFTGNTLTGGHGTALGQGITISAATGVPGYSGTVNYNVDNNTINGSILSAITVNLGTSAGGGVMQGTVNNNIIGTAGSAKSGSLQGNGIAIEAHGNGTHTAKLQGNTIREAFDRGIYVMANDGNGTLNLSVLSNNLSPAVSSDINGARESFYLNNGSTSTNIFGQADSHTVRLDLSGNSLSHGIGTSNDFNIRQRINSRVELPGYPGTAFDTAAVKSYIQGRNNGTAAELEPGIATATDSAAVTTDGYFATVGAVPTPP